MTREDKLKIATNEYIGYPPEVDEDIAVSLRRAAFTDGAKWADEHPDSKHTYTKQQLIDIGFAFTTNGDIVTPDQLNEDLKKYLEYRKQKFIEKACNWLEDCAVVDIEEFKKAMEE